MEEKIILECYQCSTQFKISPSLLGSQGKKVRCARCKHEWIAKAPNNSLLEPTVNAEDIQPILPGTTSSLIAESAKKENLFYRAPLENQSTFLSGLFLMVTILFLIPSLLYLGRYKIVELVPNVRPLYQCLGFDTGEDLKSFTLSNLTYTQALQNGVSTIIVKSNLINTTKRVLKSPNILISLYGTGNCPPLTWKDKLLGGEFSREEGHCILERWTVQINDGQMLPAQTIAIESSRPIDSKWQLKHVFLDLVRR